VQEPGKTPLYITGQKINVVLSLKNLFLSPFRGPIWTSDLCFVAGPTFLVVWVVILGASANWSIGCPDRKTEGEESRLARLTQLCFQPTVSGVHPEAKFSPDRNFAPCPCELVLDCGKFSRRRESPAGNAITQRQTLVRATWVARSNFFYCRFFLGSREPYLFSFLFIVFCC
jgi:hypothetical protein